MEEEEENNERNLGSDFNGFEFVAASEGEEEIHINSKSESNNTPPVLVLKRRQGVPSPAPASRKSLGWK